MSLVFKVKFLITELGGSPGASTLRGGTPDSTYKFNQ